MTKGAPSAASPKTTALPTMLFSLSSLPVPAALIDASGIVVERNAAFEGSSVAALTDASHSQVREGPLRILLQQIFADGEVRPGRYALQLDADTRFHAQVSQPAEGDALALILFLQNDTVSAPRGLEPTVPRGQALVDRLREEAARVRSVNDFASLLPVMRQGLRELGLSVFSCGVNIIDQMDPPVLRIVGLSEHTFWKHAHEAGARLIVEACRAGTPTYRQDLSTEDLFDERERFQRRNPIRSVLDVPFKCGTVAINSLEAHAFDNKDVILLQQIAEAVGEGYARAEAQMEIRRATALAESIEAVARAQDLGSALDDFVRAATSITNSNYGLLSLYDAGEDALVPRSQLGHDWAVFKHVRLRPGESLSGTVYATGKPIIFANGEGESNTSVATMQTWKKATGRTQMENWSAGAPIWLYGQVIGVLTVAADEGTFGKRDLETLERLADQAALALEREERKERFDRDERQLHALHELRTVVWQMRAAGDIDDVVGAIETTLKSLRIDYDFCGICLFEPVEAPERMCYGLTRQSGRFEHGTVALGTNPGADMLVCSWREQRIAYRPDLESQDAIGEAPRLATGFGGSPRCVIDVPFSHGTLALNSTKPQAFGDDVQKSLLRMAEILGEGFRRRDDLRHLERANQDLALQRDELLLAQRAALIRRVQSDIRSRVWQMRTPDDLAAVLALMGEGLLELGVRQDSMSLQIVSADGRNFSVISNEAEFPDTQQAIRHFLHDNLPRLNYGERYPWVLEAWRTGEPVYQPCGALVGKLRDLSIIDAPFNRGTFAIHQRRPNAYSDDDIQAVVAITTMVEEAVARCIDLEREQSLRRRAEQDAMLDRVCQTIRHGVWRMDGPEKMGGLLVALQEGLRELGIPYWGYGINLVEEEEGGLRAYWALGDSGFDAHLDSSSRIIEDIWRKAETCYRPDLDVEDPYGEREFMRTLHSTPIRCVLDVPFHSGTIAINSTEPNVFTELHIEQIQVIAKHLSEGFDRRKDLIALQAQSAALDDQRTMLNALHEIGSATLLATGPEEILDTLVEQILSTKLLRSVMIALVDAEKNEIVSVRAQPVWKQSGEDTRLGRRYSLDDENIVAVTARTGVEQIIDGWSERFDVNVDKTDSNFNDRTSYFIPIRAADSVVAVIATGSDQADKEMVLMRLKAMRPLLTQVGAALDSSRAQQALQIRSRELADVNVQLESQLVERRWQQMRSAALATVRDAVWWMLVPDDIHLVLQRLREALLSLDVDVQDCGVNVLGEASPDAAHMEHHYCFYTLKADSTNLRTRTDDPSWEIVRRWWLEGKVVYRRDLAAEDGNEERAGIEDSFDHPVRSVVDVPFSHGTLAVNSPRPDAFSDWDVAVLVDLAAVLSEGFGRLDDLRAREWSSKTYRSLFDSAADALILLDGKTNRIKDVNDQWSHLLGWEREATLGTKLADYAGPATPSPTTDAHSLSPAVLYGTQRTGEWPLGHRDGSVVWCEIVLKRIDESAPEVLARITDISDRVAAREMRRALSRRAAQLQEDERRRIARDLHDGVNQVLSAASAQLFVATRRRGIEGDEGLGQVREYLDEAIEEIRRLSRALRPTILDDLGLVPALRSIGRALADRADLQVHVAGEEEVMLTKEESDTVFRIAQEALTNIERHAAASEVSIRLVVEEAMATLTIEDNGRGTDLTIAGQGMGLRNIAERAMLLGGRAKIESQPNEGMRINVWIPRQRQDKE